MNFNILHVEVFKKLLISDMISVKLQIENGYVSCEKQKTHLPNCKNNR